MSYVCTLRDKVSFQGVALHSGKTVSMQVLPADASHGITFTRTDKGPHAPIPALAQYVSDATLATTLSLPDASSVSVSTVEHLLAALWGMGIDNARVLLDGPEVPVMDGSSSVFVEAFQQAGVVPQNRPKRWMRIKRPVEVLQGAKKAAVYPFAHMLVEAVLDFNHPLIPSIPCVFDASKDDFCQDIASARTFGFLRDVEMLRSKGLALGGSLDNAVVMDGYRILNEGGLRYPNEFVKHKILDALGDLALLGCPLVGRVELFCSGHAMHVALARAVLADPTCYETMESSHAGALFKAWSITDTFSQVSSISL
jgi:UDP-3-O-[3-hydroxymyristoyl] N-acetylglucosamine deacetylase